MRQARRSIKFASFTWRLLFVLCLSLGAVHVIHAIIRFTDYASDQSLKARLFYLEAESAYSEMLASLERVKGWEAALSSRGWVDLSCPEIEPKPSRVVQPNLGALIIGPAGEVICDYYFGVSQQAVRDLAKNALAPSMPRSALGAVDDNAFVAFRINMGGREGIFAVDLGPIPVMPDGASRTLLLSRSGLIYDSAGARDPRLSSPATIYDAFADEHDLAFVRAEELGATIVAVGPEKTFANSTIRVFLLVLVTFALSVAAVFVAVDWLLGGYLRDLPHRIRRFGDTLTYKRGRSAPNVSEFVASESEFIRMLKRLHERDQAQQKDIIDRKFLLKELNHRVHNNLQTISSLMSISIRRSKNEHEKRSLANLQDKVLTLAATHRALFQGDGRGMISSNLLLREVVGQRIDIIDSINGANFSMDVDDLMIVPDQAVPLALFAVEGVARAFAASEDIGNAFGVRLYFYSSGEDEVTLLIENSSLQDEAVYKTNPDDVGRGLLQVYAAQLGGQLETQFARTSFALRPGQFKTAEQGGFAQVLLTFRLDQEIRSQVDF